MDDKYRGWDKITSKLGYIEKTVPLFFQESMEKEGWETVGYDEYSNGIPRDVVMQLKLGKED